MNKTILLYLGICALIAVVSYGWASIGVYNFGINFAGFAATSALYFALGNSERLSKIAPTESEKRTNVMWNNDWDNDQV